MSEKKRYRSSEWYNSKTHKRDTFVHGSEEATKEVMARIKDKAHYL